MSVRALALAAQVDTNGTNYLEIAEKIGKVELEAKSGGYRACIEIGSFWDIQLKVWAMGSNTSQALQAVIAKTEKVLEALEKGINRG